jgi:crotonobetainyl-CoA:carnitine CoA-transferase CaiB-like acyl-CoA transferase
MSHQRTDEARTSLPLAGIRVLDCSRILAGPFATMLLADLGADVIKVEPPSGDDTRGWGPPFWGPREDGLSAYFTSVNRNKRSVVIDLKTEAGRSTLDQLARQSDLLVHNYRPGTAERLGLDSTRLAEVNPDLVTAVVGGFAGDDDAVRNRPAYDLLAQAVSGLMSVTGEEGGAPRKVGVAVLDLIVGLEVAIASLAALLGRDADRVQHVEVSLVEAGLTSLINVLANYLATGEEPRRYGSAHPNIAPYQLFPTADGHIVIAVGSDGQFARLLSVLGLSDDDGRFSTNADRLSLRDALTGWIGSAVAARGRAELVDALLEADIPAGAVLGVSDSVAAMEAAHDGSWVEEIDGIRLAPSPFRIDGRRSAIRRAPPRLGEHTGEVMDELGELDP